MTPVFQCVIDKHRPKFESKLRLKHFLKKIILSPSCLEKKQVYDKPNIYGKYTNEPNKAVLIMSDTSNSSEKDFIVICDHVVCTTSLGYLKENLKRLRILRLGSKPEKNQFIILNKPIKVKIIEDCENLIWVISENTWFKSKIKGD